MQKIIQKYKLPIALLLLLLTAIGIWQGVLLYLEYKDHKDRAAAFDEALAQIDPANTAVSFRIPYESKLFTAQNIGLGQLDETGLAALDALLSSLTYDREANESSCFATENVLVQAALPQGRLTLSMGDDAICVVQTSADGIHWETAAYSYDTAARDVLLACGGLPTIAEMKEAIENNLQSSVNNLDTINKLTKTPK